METRESWRAEKIVHSAYCCFFITLILEAEREREIERGEKAHTIFFIVRFYKPIPFWFTYSESYLI